MARTAEVVTIASLNSLLVSAKGDFAKGEQAKKIAEQVKNIPDAYSMLMESVTMHEAEGFKNLRKVVVKIVNALDESSTDCEAIALLITVAQNLSLFAEK